MKILFKKIKALIFKIYNEIEFYPFLTPFKDVITLLFKRVLDITDYLLKNKEGYKEFNIPKKWFYENKALGISGVARLHNSEDFLELVIENHLQFLDEIILVNNLSTDRTKEICLKLKDKYPDKIKYYEYPFKIERNDLNISSNSIYSLSYYTNRCFSKTKYKYVMKVDDDNYFNVNKMKEIRKYILNKQPKKIIAFWGLNIIKKNDNIGVFKKYPYSGKFLDHEIYPVNKNTYFINKGICEVLQHKYLVKRMGFAFFHLKYLKKDKGLGYTSNEIRNKYLNLFDNTDIDNLDRYINFEENREFIEKIKQII